MASKFLFSILTVLLFASFANAASENLDEIDARKARQSTSYWGKEYLENPQTLVWQPETLCYTDAVTGAEVWRLSSTNGIKNSLPDISWAHWSADGKRFSFGSHRDTSANDSGWETDTNSTRQGAVMMMRADGSYLRPADNAPFEVYVHSRYLHWSPVEPDVYYGFGRNFAGEGLGSDELYKVTVGDTSITKELVLDLNLGGSEISIAKSMASDGSMLAAETGGNMYAITLLPTVSIADADGFASFRALDTYWGDAPAIPTISFHDRFLRGVAGDLWFYFMPDSDVSWWRMRLSGSGADGGPEHIVDNTAPYSWGDVEPVLTGNGSGGSCVDPLLRSPWNCDGDGSTGPEQYMSHPGFDRWGRLVAGTNSQQFMGWGVWDMTNHAWIDSNIPAPHYDWHTDWSAWSDYFASSPSAIHTDNNIYTNKYDGTDTIAIASAHIRESGSTDYNSLPRVTQSPDGTKVVFHSDFLNNNADTWDLFYAVAYYPHPPEITSITGTGTYTIRFDWRLSTTPRGYTQRGWPDESLNKPPPPRETTEFRLWRSKDGVSNWLPIKTVNADIFSKYDFSTGEWRQDDFWEITDTPSTGSWYYAVTAIEHSGLESRVLSNIYSSTGNQTTPYPENPKGKVPFFTSTPKPPVFSVTKLEEPGHYRLDWPEPNDSMIRYYNIYYSSSSSPDQSQNKRIASVPKGTTSYIDWLADQNSSANYLITSVDSQGNESSMIRILNIYLKE